MTGEYKEYESMRAFAKLQGPNTLKYIKTSSVYLGREVAVVEQNEDEEVLFISNSNKISRKHVSIFWDKTKSAWFAKNLSKNHIYINKAVLKISSEPIKLDPICSIQIDECKFYFFQARESEVEVINLDTPVPQAGEEECSIEHVEKLNKENLIDEEMN